MLKLFPYFIIFILVFSLFTPNIPFSFQEKKAEALEPITTRYACHEVKDYQNGTHEASFGLPCWVKGSPYTKWLMTAYTDRIEMKNGMYASQLNTSDSTNRFYDLYYHDLKSTENWVVEYWNGNAWVDSGINSATPTISTLQNNSGIFVTSTRQNLNVKLSIVYITLEGQSLKHNIELKNLGTEKEFRLKQVHDVKDTNTVSLASGSITSIGTQFVSNDNIVNFYHSNYTLMMTERQSSEYYRNVTLTNINSNLNAEFLFGNKLNTNQTGLTLSQNEVFSMESGATCTASGGDTTCAAATYFQGISGTTGTTGSSCTAGGVEFGTNTQKSSGSTDKLNYGKEDNERCYLFGFDYDVTNIPSGATVSAVAFTWASGLFEVSHHVNTGSIPNLDFHYVNDADCTGTNEELDDVYPDMLDAPTIATNIDPTSTFNGNTVSYTDSTFLSYVTGQLESGTAATGSEAEHICFGYSQTGSDITGDASNHDGYKSYPPVITITYSTSITMSFDINDNAGTLLPKGNILLRATSGSNAGVASATYTACDNECTFTATPSATYTFAVQWNAANTGAGHLLNYVKVDIGGTTFNSTHTHSCSSNCDVELNTQIYQNIDIEFRDDNNELHSPNSVTVVHTDNSTEKTYSAFSSKGIMTFGLLGVGNSSSFTIKDVEMYGKNVVTNASATVTPNEINDNIQHNNKVYLYDFRFISNDKTIYLKNGDVAYHIKLENGTEKTITADFTEVQISNQSILSRSIKYQGWSINDNSTQYSLGLKTDADNKYSATNKTVLIYAKYFKVLVQAKESTGTSNIASVVNYKSTLANTTAINAASTETGSFTFHVGNGSQTLNIFWRDLNVSSSVFNPTASGTSNINTNIGLTTDNEVLFARNNSVVSQISFASDTLQFNATQNAHEAGEEITKIEILDRTYANNAAKRVLNVTEADTGFTFDDPVITDTWTMNGETLVKYVLSAGTSPGNLGGGGGGGASQGGRNVQRSTDTVLAGVGFDTEDMTEFENRELIILAVLLIGVGIVSFGGLGTSTGRSSSRVFR